MIGEITSVTDLAAQDSRWPSSELLGRENSTGQGKGQCMREGSGRRAAAYRVLLTAEADLVHIQVPPSG